MADVKLYIAADHAGLELKNLLKGWLKPKHSLLDLGVHVPERIDYPIMAIRLAKRVASQPDAKGILVCGTGIGMSIVANKIPGVRAAVIYDGLTAKMARAHNNANIACLGARNITFQTALLISEIFLETEFAGKNKEGKRHLKRVERIENHEKKIFK